MQILKIFDLCPDSLKCLLSHPRLIGPEISQNNVFASALIAHVGKKEDGIYAVFEGKNKTSRSYHCSLLLNVPHY